MNYNLLFIHNNLRDVHTVNSLLSLKCYCYYTKYVNNSLILFIIRNFSQSGSHRALEVHPHQVQRHEGANPGNRGGQPELRGKEEAKPRKVRGEQRAPHRRPLSDRSQRPERLRADLQEQAKLLLRVQHAIVRWHLVNRHPGT